MKCIQTSRGKEQLKRGKGINKQINKQENANGKTSKNKEYLKEGKIKTKRSIKKENARRSKDEDREENAKKQMIKN